MVMFFLLFTSFSAVNATDLNKGTTLGLSDSSEYYVQEIVRSKIPVLVDFWAEWCGPCRLIAPAISDIKKEYKGRIKVLKVNIDRNRKLAYHFKIRSIPLVILFEDKAPVQVLPGAQSKEAYVAMIKKVLQPIDTTVVDTIKQ